MQNHTRAAKAEEWQPPRVTSKRFSPGEVVPYSWIFVVLGANGKKLKQEVTLTEGDFFPPLPPGGRAYQAVKPARWGVEIVKVLERIRRRGTWGRGYKI
jgi:hypothetical protein